MKKIAFFLEGQTEVIFVERLLTEIAGAHRIQIVSRKSRGSTAERSVQIYASEADGEQQYFALLIDSGSDSTVASDIRDNYDKLVAAGYNAIVGVRDVYPNSAEKIPDIQRLLHYRMKTSPLAPKIILAVMEVECWFLGEHTHFTSIDAALTCARISEDLGFDPSADDVEAREDSADRGRADDRVDARGGAAADQDAQLLRLMDHGQRPLPSRRARGQACRYGRRARRAPSRDGVG